MEITIFTELTTNDHLDQLKVEADKYTGLYVDMNIAKERKYVKDKAADIKSLLSKVERLRIDATADYKVKVEAEAADIKERLEIANLPFTLLIDEYAIERKKILDAEKAEKIAIEVAVKLEADHEFALLMNDKFDSDKRDQLAAMAKYEADMKAEAAAEAKEEAERIAKETEQRIEHEKQEAIQREEAAKQAQASAEREAIAAQEREKVAAEQAEVQRKQAAIDAENARIKAEVQRKQDAVIAEQNRLEAAEQAKQAEIFRQQEEKKIADEDQAKLEANKKHVGMIRGEIKTHLMSTCEINEELAIKIVKALLKTNRVTINY